jgi:UDP-N-acetyl-D-mannosaminuronate dehydrogenase
MGLVEKTKNKIAGIGTMALGYVGLPPATEFGKTGFFVTGFDIDSRKIKVLKKG